MCVKGVLIISWLSKHCIMIFPISLKIATRDKKVELEANSYILLVTEIAFTAETVGAFPFQSNGIMRPSSIALHSSLSLTYIFIYYNVCIECWC